MSAIVRFAPSPTGLIHIGGMRVALINYLFAKQQGGKFILRIEDTDRERYKPEFVDAIDSAMAWLGMKPDLRIVQSENLGRYRKAADYLLSLGRAYYCHCSQEHIHKQREMAIANKQTYKYDGRCRGNMKPGGVVRIDSSAFTELVFEDILYGRIHAGIDNLSDAVIMRGNDIPTFVFAAAVDDAHLSITHVIRGNDHITNTALQIMIMRLLDSSIPHFAHIPLILDIDGNKLSKRHGAADLNHYRTLGFLAEAIKNYLLYLGGGLGDKELAMTDAELVGCFSLEKFSLSPARFDMAKLCSINRSHIKHRGDIIDIFSNFYKERHGFGMTAEQHNRIILGIKGLIERSSTLIEMENSAACYLKERPIPCCEPVNVDLLKNISAELKNLDDWGVVDSYLREYIKKNSLSNAAVFPSLRVAITGEKNSPAIGEIMLALGKYESLSRLDDVIINQ